MHIEPGEVGMQHVHDDPPCMGTAGMEYPSSGTLENMLRGPTGPWQTQGCSDIPDPTKQRARSHQEHADLSADDAADTMTEPAIRFIPSGLAPKANAKLSTTALPRARSGCGPLPCGSSGGWSSPFLRDMLRSCRATHCPATPDDALNTMHKIRRQNRRRW